MSLKLSVLKLVCAANLLVATFAIPVPNGYNYDHVGNYVNLENTYMSKPNYDYSVPAYPNYQPHGNFHGLFGQDLPIHPVHSGIKPQYPGSFYNPYQTIFLIRTPTLQQFTDTHGTQEIQQQPQPQVPHLSSGLPDSNSMFLSEPTLPNPNQFTIPEMKDLVSPMRIPSVEMTPIFISQVSPQVEAESEEEIPQEISLVPQKDAKTEVQMEVQEPEATFTSTVAPTTTITTTTTTTESSSVMNEGTSTTTNTNQEKSSLGLDGEFNPFRPVSQDDAITTQNPEDDVEEDEEIENKEKSLQAEKDMVQVISTEQPRGDEAVTVTPSNETDETTPLSSVDSE